MEKKDPFDYTSRAISSMNRAVNDDYFRDNDAEVIFKMLEEQLELISFGDYLKRYIYTKAKIEMPFDMVDIKEYQSILKSSFDENSTPVSFSETTAKLSALSKNWLTQSSVSRNVVLLLGFGLDMDVDDVNMFLTKGIQENALNPKNPQEAICWFCYTNHLKFPEYKSLWEQFEQLRPAPMHNGDVSEEYTVNIRNTLYAVRDEKSLMRYLAGLKKRDNTSRFSYTARKMFDKLYLEARLLIAKSYDKTEEEKFEKRLEAYSRKLWNSEKLYDYQKRERIEQMRSSRKTVVADDITEADIEKIICSAIPRDRHGTLTPAKVSSLNKQFQGKRFSRQHIGKILSGEIEIDRFDLITLNFFIFANKLEKFPRAKSRYSEFLDSTNKMLGKCSMGELYVQNPYECFVLMCMLSEEPLCTYADVLELSYG